jgi:Fe-S oxidoreductase
LLRLTFTNDSCSCGLCDDTCPKDNDRNAFIDWLEVQLMSRTTPSATATTGTILSAMMSWPS